MTNLKYLKVLSKFELLVSGDKFEVIQSESKVETPSYIKISIQLEVKDFAAQILQLLYGFCKYQNATNFIVESQKCNFQHDLTLKQLYHKIQQLINLRILTLPLGSYDGITQDIIEMLKALKKLDYLFFFSQPNQDVDADIIQAITQFAIDHLGELRLIQFYLAKPITLQGIDCKHRASPFHVKMIIESTPKYKYHSIFDGRFGLKKIVNKNVEDQEQILNH
ncbi:hypothetical protein FGO68_gene12598 [Halteria grandinella]|uniref:Uncharacterized protein n=1 Tax=Halteria grandinella TaxID=5974 RepID=A0A8J8NFE1_HALGN|nr:hypothetical protein FGO68_gene12598 [Halteria grandinella]